MYYQFIPPYLFDPNFTLNTDKLIDKKLYFLDRKTRLKLKGCLHKPTNVFFNRNVNWDNFQFVVGGQLDGEPDASSNVVYSAISHNDKPELVRNVQEYMCFFSNLALDKSFDVGTPYFENKGVYYHTFSCVPHEVLNKQQLLNEQLHWTIETDSDGSVLDKICKSLSRYNDFYGLFCCYDGDRNLAIHTEWDSKALSPEKFRNPYVPDDKNLDYEPIGITLMNSWETVAGHISEVIKEERGVAVSFNSYFRNPYSVRRLPFGVRRSGAGEFFDVGSKIPQIELYSNTKHSLYDHLNSKGPLHVLSEMKRIHKT